MILKIIPKSIPEQALTFRSWPKLSNSVNFIDMGGIRSERRKWIHSFKAVGSIIFLVSLSEYDQMMYGDRNITRLDESIALFETVMEWFEYSSFILFLNKMDIFKQRIMYSDSYLSKYYPDFDGPEKDEIAAQQFIFSKFDNAKPKFHDEFFDWKENDSRFFELNKKVNQNQNHRHNQVTYTHPTCMLDSTSIPGIIESLQNTLRDIILWKNLECVNIA